MRRIISALFLFAASVSAQSIFFTSNVNTLVPSFSPVSGGVAPGTVVTISASTGCSAYIYYSQVHNPPTTSDSNGSTFTVSASGTWYARQIGCPGFTDSAVGTAAYTVVVITRVTQSAPSTGASGSVPATGAIDTTGASLLLVAVSRQAAAAGSCTVTDSKGNTWHAVSSGGTDSSNTSTAIFYAYNHGGTALSVGAGHTASLSGFACVGIQFTAYSGTKTSADPLDQQNASTATGQIGTATPGSITPTGAGYLVFTSMDGNAGASTTAPTVSSPFTVVQSSATSSTSVAIGSAEWIQTTATAANPTWTTGGNSFHDVAAIASFKLGVN